MKKNLEGGEGRTRTAGQRAGVRTAAVAGCLMALLAGWSGAAAQGFDENHAVDKLTNWNQVQNGGNSWVLMGDTAAAINTDVGNSPTSFLINKYSCMPDGIYTVTFARAGSDDVSTSPASGGIVFRYTNPNQYYYLMVQVNGYGPNWTVALFKNNAFVPMKDGNFHSDLNDDLVTAITGATGYIGHAKGTNSSGDRLNYSGPYSNNPAQTEWKASTVYKIQIVIKDGTFEVRNLRKMSSGAEETSRTLATFTDPNPLTEGDVGYAARTIWYRARTIGFLSSSWENTSSGAQTPASVGYPGFYVWNKGTNKTFTGGDGAWSGNFWSKDSSMAVGAWGTGPNDALFIAAPKGDITANGQNVGSIAFALTGYKITSGTLALGASPRTITVAAGDAVINATLSGTGGLTTKDGAGKLTLGGSAANTYRGGTAISAGTVEAAKSGALGDSATGRVTVSAGGVLQLSGTGINNPLTLGGGTLSNSSGVNTLSGPILVNGASTIGVPGGSLTLSGAISGSANITKTGTEILYITAENTYSGTMAVSGGGLQINGSGSLGGVINAASGTTVTFTRASGATVTQPGITGAGNLVKDGAGTLILNGSNSGHTGSVTINTGILQIANIASIGPATVTVAPNGTLRLSTTTFPKNIVGTSSGTGILEKTGTDTLKLAGTDALDVGKVYVSGGVLSVNRQLSADSIRIATGAQLELVYSGTIGKAGSKIAVNAGGVLVVPVNVGSGGVSNKSDVILNSTGMIRNRSAQVLDIGGSLTMTANSTIELSLSACKTRAPINVGKSAALNGTFDLILDRALADGDAGDYKLIAASDGISTAATAVTVKINGEEKPSGYDIEKTVSDGYLIITVKKQVTVDPTTFNLRVTGVTAGTQANTVNVTVGGFNSIRAYTDRLTGAYIIYRPNFGAATLTDTTLNGGRISIPVSDFPASGDTKAFTVTVPSAKISDTLYYFNAVVVWSGAATTLTPSPSSNIPSAYLIDPKTKVLANGFGITVDSYKSEVSGVTFELTITGQNDANLTPSATYKPRVDSVAVWFKKNGTAPAFAGNGNALNKAAVVGADTILVFALSRLAADGKFSFQTGAVTGASDMAYFAVAPRWKGTRFGVAFDSIARPLYTRNQSVPNPTKNQPNNPVALSYKYQNDDRRQPTISITVSTSEPLNDVAESVRIELAFDQSMSDAIAIANNQFTKAQVNTGLPPIEVTDDRLVGETRTLYYRVTVSGDGSDIFKDGSFTDIGRDKPIAPANLDFVALGKGNGLLTWNRITSANNVGDMEQSKIHIYYGTGPIATAGESLISVSASATEAPLTNLDSETEYWFAVVLEDIVNTAKPSWNLRSDASSITANSGAAYVALNIVQIDTVIFVESNASFSVTYTLMEDKTSQTLSYDVTLDQNGSELVKSGSNIYIDKSNAGDKGTVTISLGSDLRFNTTYWVHLYTVEGNGTPGAGKSSKDVTSGAFTMQDIVIPPRGSAYADEANFKLDAEEWNFWNIDQTPITVTVAATRTPAESDIVTEGFIPVGEYGYSYKVAANNLSYMYERFKISIAIGENMPAGYSPDDVGIYRWNDTEKYWEVVFDSTKYESGYVTGLTIDKAESESESAIYRLLIDTSATTVDIPENDMAGVNGISNEETFIRSNVGNFKVSMLSGPALGAADPQPIALTGDEKGKNRRIRFTISSDIVNESNNSGVLAFIIVNDGRETVANLSYRVTSETYSGFDPPSVRVLRNNKRWTPFATQAKLLDNQSARSILEPVLYKNGEEMGVHDTLYRLFRYDKNEWVEYNTQNDNQFTMEPAQLMWFKTSVKGITFKFGRTESLPLRKDYEIKLPPKQWTDIVMPFRFDVYLGDIKNATNKKEALERWNSLQFYRWEKGEPQFLPVLLNKPGAADTVTLNGMAEPFSVYNNSSSEITLCIPPKPTAVYKKSLSKVRALAKAAGAQQGAGEAWHYTLHATADGSELSELHVGYYTTDMPFAVPPSFGNESVVLVGDDGVEMGHHFGPSIASGRTYKLRFYNDGKQQKDFAFSAKPSANTPVGARVTFVKASTGEILSNGSGSAQSVAVAGMSHEDVFMIVGGNGYRAKAASVSAGAKFAISKVIVNRAARSARINFYVPESGINQVDVSIYDIKGRQVWKTVQKTKAASWNSVEWNGRNSRRGATSTGLYIVRVKAIGTNGRPVGADTKRIMFAR